MCLKDDLSIESCLACGHPKKLHRVSGGACYADPQKLNVPSEENSYPLADVEVRKRMGIECWCWAWSDNPKRASEEIFNHGPYASLRPGIEHAIDRGDLDSARRLLIRLRQETPEQEWDDLCKRYFRNHLSELRRAYQEQRREFSAASQQNPATWESLRLEFERLADAELQRYPHNERVLVLRGSWISAYAYDGEGEHFGREFYRISVARMNVLKAHSILPPQKQGSPWV